MLVQRVRITVQVTTTLSLAAQCDVLTSALGATTITDLECAAIGTGLAEADSDTLDGGTSLGSEGVTSTTFNLRYPITGASAR